MTPFKHDFYPYVMKCLLLSGYDEKDFIQAMDTTENEGNSISTIERYINERHRDDPELNFGLCSGNPSLPFQFPPGHRLWICNFVKKVKEKCNPSLKRKCDSSKSGGAVKRSRCNNNKPVVNNSSAKSISTNDIISQVTSFIEDWVKKTQKRCLQSSGAE